MVANHWRGCRDGVDHLLQEPSVEALGCVDVADLLPLGVRHRVDLVRPASALGLVGVALCDGGGVSDGAHRDRFGDGRGETGDQQDGGGSAARDHPQDDAEDVHEAVLTAQDHVTRGVAPAVMLPVHCQPGGACRK
jgi:hypothetical protein